MRFADGEVSGMEANQADTNLSLAKPSEQPRVGGNVSQPVQVPSAAQATESKTEPEEDLLEGIQFVWEEFLTFKYINYLLSCFLFQKRRICVPQWLGRRV